MFDDRPPVAVVTFYLYKATKAVEFYRPIMYLYFLSAGLDFTQIALLEAVYNATTIFGEVPTGYVGDRIGRRNSLLVGTLLIAGTLVGLGLAASFPAFLALYACWSLGYTFRSGTEDAWLYETLEDVLDTDDFTRIRGRAQAVALGVGVVGSVVGGYIAGFDLAYPFYVAAVVTALGAVFLLRLDEPTSYEEAESLSVRDALGVVREAVTSEGVRAFVLYYFVLFASVSYLVFVYLQPVLETVLSGLGVTNVEGALGWYYAAIGVVSAGLSYRTDWVRERVGTRTWFLVVPFGIGGFLAVLSFAPLLALPAFVFARGITSVTRSLAGQYVNDRIETAGRATTLSAMSMASALAVVPVQVASGVVADAYSPVVALGAGGVFLVVGSAVVLALSDAIIA